MNSASICISLRECFLVVLRARSRNSNLILLHSSLILLMEVICQNTTRNNQYSCYNWYYNVYDYNRSRFSCFIYLCCGRGRSDPRLGITNWSHQFRIKRIEISLHCPNRLRCVCSLISFISSLCCRLSGSLHVR